ncbi:MAG TPA: hypothetical protein VE801_15790 [Xanthobacteraceae bacterium]|nr:hypothetical protein [Xanthobacteraceae bacterium]
MKSKSFDLKHFSLDSRYTNLPEERIQRNYVSIPIRCRRFGQRGTRTGADALRGTFTAGGILFHKIAAR